MEGKRRDLPPDDQWIDADDIDTIREEARRRAHVLLSEGYQLGQNRRGWIIDVEDESGAVVLSISLADATAA